MDVIRRGSHSYPLLLPTDSLRVLQTYIIASSWPAGDVDGEPPPSRIPSSHRPTIDRRATTTADTINSARYCMAGMDHARATPSQPDVPTLADPGMKVFIGQNVR